MFDFEKYNKTGFTVNTEGFEYKNLMTLHAEDPDRTYVVRGIYINDKGKYGPSPLFATDSCYVNLPSHLLEICKELRADREAVNAINEGHMGFKIYPYEANGSVYYSVELVNL